MGIYVPYLMGKKERKKERKKKRIASYRRYRIDREK